MLRAPRRVCERSCFSLWEVFLFWIYFDVKDWTQNTEVWYMHTHTYVCLNTHTHIYIMKYMYFCRRYFKLPYISQIFTEHLYGAMKNRDPGDFCFKILPAISTNVENSIFWATCPSYLHIISSFSSFPSLCNIITNDQLFSFNSSFSLLLPMLPVRPYAECCARLWAET